MVDSPPQNEADEAVSSGVLKARLIARRYQEELFARAKQGNVIVCLDTGAGKTLVAAMLIEHVYSLEQARLSVLPTAARRNKVALFLVNLVPLAHQQAAFLDANIPATVDVLYGELEARQSSRHYWEDVFENGVGVVVCTAQCVLNAVIHAYLKLDDVSLLIFDEAHHAVGNDTYARLMTYYRLLPVEQRPKVFGMTASPLLSTSSSLEESSTILETVLDAKVFALPPHARKELLAYLHRPTELVVEYARTPLWESMPAAHLPKVRSRLIAEMPESADFDKVLVRMDYYWETFGPVFSDLAWLSSKDELRRQAAIKDHFAKEIEAEDLVNPALARAARSKYSQLAEGAVCRRQLANLLEEMPVPEEVTLDSSNASPQLLRFLEVLECFKGQADTFCGIVFCNRRITAMTLQLLIQRTPSLASFIHCEGLVGHASSHAGTDAMSWEEQCRILSRLRRRAPTNLVIATSVLEEGLDIMPVNCVIRFDPPQHHVGYVQSRGRARSANSTYILMVEQGERKHANLLTGIVKAEAMLQDWLSNVPEDRLASAIVEEDSGDEREALRKDENAGLLSQSLTDEETGARLYPIDSVSLLAHYVALLRADDFSPTGPDIEIEGDHGSWSGTVHLPANCPIRIVRGPVARSKLAARRLVAFEACRQLHEIGHLDKHLAPRKSAKKFSERLEALEYDLQGIGEVNEGTPENMVSCRHRIPNVLASPSIPSKMEAGAKITVHCTIIATPGERMNGEPMRPLGLVTTRPLMALWAPQAVTLVKYAGLCDVSVAPPRQSFELTWTDDQVRSVVKYTATLLSLITPHDFEGQKWPYLVLPLNEGQNDVNWLEINAVTDPPAKQIPLTELGRDGSMDDKLLLDSPHCRAGAARTYVCLDVDHTLSPHDKIPKDAIVREGDGESTFWDLFHRTQLRKQSRLEKDQTPAKSRRPCQDEQPMLVARRVPRRLENYLTTDNQRSKAHSQDLGYLIPQYHYTHCIRASMYESARLFPSIMTAVERILLARELNEDLFDGQVDTVQLLSALTAPAARQAISYERLEYLGDTFLKAVTGAYVFAKSDERVEGFLHLDRRAIVSNAILIDNTKDLKLGQVLYTQRWTRKTWCPPLLTASSLRENPADRMNHLSAKMLADVVEALIGAAVATPYEGKDSSFWVNIELALTVTLRLGVLKDDRVTDIESIATLWREQVEPKALSGNWDDRLNMARLHNLEKRLGYKFKKPYLALESLTHPGHLRATLPSYQRLEFLGDGLLDLFINMWLLKEYPNSSEGQLTRMKGAAVSNQALTAFCAYKGLQKCLQAQWANSSLRHVILEATLDHEFARKRSDDYWRVEERHKRRVAHRRRKQKDTHTNSSEGSSDGETEESDSKPNDEDFEIAALLGQAPLLHYWAPAREVKSMADVVESTLGAIFVDAGFDFVTAWTFFQRYHLPWFRQYCTKEALQQREQWEQLMRQAEPEAEEVTDSQAQQLPSQDAEDADSEHAEGSGEEARPESEEQT
ncbi:unnamed protein product [Parajaminaea phylloscopi]